jgi:hypothetical protein
MATKASSMPAPNLIAGVSPFRTGMTTLVEAGVRWWVSYTTVPSGAM